MISTHGNEKWAGSRRARSLHRPSRSRRILSCMTLAVMQEGKMVTTIEGLEQHAELHPLQTAFIEYDGFQCGFCTSGQIMSGVAVIDEGTAGWPSAATRDVAKPFTAVDPSDVEIRERMSGELCRCACYPNIVDAVAAPARHQRFVRYGAY
jgi:xanthine dehydrogenase YagT iron-sulfur-binding subunit